MSETIKRYFPFVFTFDGREYSGKEELYIKHIIEKWKPETDLLFEKIKADLSNEYPELVDVLVTYPWDGKE